AKVLLFSATVAMLAGTTLHPGAASGATKKADLSRAGIAAACPATSDPNQAQCQAEYLTKSPTSTVPLATTTFQNELTPADIQDAYNLPASGGEGRTVALVESKNYPTLESDLATYRAQFGLAPCTTANGCLTIVNQNGGPKLPGQGIGIGWFVETALDV